MADSPTAFGIAFELTGVGWAEATIHHGDESLSLRASYMGDALGDLARAVLRLRTDDHQQFLWAHEPGYWRWRLHREPGQSVALEIAKLGEQGDGRPAETVFRTEAPYAALVAVVLTILRDLNRDGGDRYRRLWDLYPFPIEEMRALESMTSTG